MEIGACPVPVDLDDQLLLVLLLVPLHGPVERHDS